MTTACPDCGTLVAMPDTDVAGTTTCPTCRRALERSAGRNIVAALACSSATFMLLWPAVLLPLMTTHTLGMRTESSIGSILPALWNHHWVILTVLIACFVVIFPLLRFGLLTIVLGVVHTRWRPPWLGRAFRWALRLNHWAMNDAFLIGCAVGYSRVAAFLPTTIEAGGWCMIVVALMTMVTRSALDAPTVWRRITPDREPPVGEAVISCSMCNLILPADSAHESCPRCAMRVSSRKPHAMVRAAAFTIAGFILYLPANFYPMNVDVQLGAVNEHRIIDGIEELIQAHLWPLAVIIFVTSIGIPAVKLLGMTWLLFSVWTRSRKHLVLKSHVFRVIDEIGHWSCLDPFTVAVFLPLIQFGALAHTDAAVGSVAFILVVVCTMFASRDFDMRLVWDAALAPKRPRRVTFLSRFHPQPRPST